ncbi:integrase [Mycobacterium phage Kumao]|uniref:Integrase n=1 Tax=Mycobacterium phage Kumao TaxID=2041344 RepID=A0A2D1GQ20_9CAUD|nr:integrase [Mycobacterium phage Kumao]ATN94058.1 integrase [Mycobacterium phage Kumao]
MEATTKAAVYLRQSIDRTGEGLAVDRQREDCLKLCEDKGWEPVEYVDNDVSASTGKPRPAYKQMLADIRSGAVQAVVAWNLDRLHRRPIELEEFIELANKHKVALATVSGDTDLSTDSGRFYARMLGVVARHEMERKSARQKAAHRQRVKQGRPWWSGPPPFGYEADEGHENIRINKEEAKLIRKAYRDVLKGVAIHTIAKEWNAQGVKTRRGNDWAGPTVRQFLANPRNAGLKVYLGEVVGKAPWPAIIDEATYKSYMAYVKAPGRGPGKPLARKHLLSGIARCGRCGGRMGVGMTGRKYYDENGKEHRVDTYACKICFKVSRDRRKTDEVVRAVMIKLLSQPDALALAARPELPNVQELLEEANTIRDRMDNLAVEFADGGITASQMRIANERLQDRLEEVERKLVDVNSRRVLDGVIGVKDVAARWDSLPVERRRAIVETIATVTIQPTVRGRPFDPSLIEIRRRFPEEAPNGL